MNQVLLKNETYFVNFLISYFSDLQSHMPVRSYSFSQLRFS